MVGAPGFGALPSGSFPKTLEEAPQPLFLASAQYFEDIDGRHGGEGALEREGLGVML
jgi:hypothetical protein